MCIFIWNIFIFSLVFGAFYLSGLGAALLILPARLRGYSFLLSPLIGMCLVTLISLFQITILLVPISPISNILIFLLISTLICCRHRFNKLQNAWATFKRQRLVIFFIFPGILILIYAWLFHVDGIHLLVGGSDQMQYCQNANHILNEMHTNSSFDSPFPRNDHYLYDQATRPLAYLKKYRRGAEVILATIAKISHLSFEEAFSVTFLFGLLTLSMILPFLGRIFLRLSLIWCMVLQFTFLNSFYFLLLHVQGTLALMMSLAPGLTSLACLTRVINNSYKQWLFLTILTLSCYFSIYTEPALINIILPCIILIIWQLQRSWYKGIVSSGRILLVFLGVFICAYCAIYYSVIGNTIANLTPIYQKIFTTLMPHEVFKQNSAESVSNLWTIFMPILGIYSYYDESTSNIIIANLFANKPWLNYIIFVTLYLCIVINYPKLKNQYTRLIICVLSLWLITSILLVSKNEPLRFGRSLEYAIPFILIGLVTFASKSYLYTYKKNTFKIISACLCCIFLIPIILLNSYTNKRTFSYLVSHNTNNDPIILHFKEQSLPWKQLKEELSLSAESHIPVLISGFKETIRPQAISIIMRNQPHVLGPSMSFGPVYYANFFTKLSELNLRLSDNEFKLAFNKETNAWHQFFQTLIKNSQQAIVPVGTPYPDEWADSKDIYQPRVKSFKNICDVIYRKDFVVTLNNKMTSELQKDSKGPFRRLLSTGPIIIRNNQDKLYTLLTLEYTGRIGDVNLKVNNRIYNGLKINPGLIRITANISSKDIDNLSLIVSHPVKLRMIALNVNVH